MSVDPVKHVDELIQKAEKKLKGSFWSWGDKDYDGAAELFTQAANQCLSQQHRQQAIELYTRAAECYLKDNNTYRTIESYNKLLPIYKSLGNSTATMGILTSIITLASANGSWNAAGKAQEALADIHKQVHGYEAAITAYLKAIDFYSYDNNRHAIRRCRQELGQLYFQLDHYIEAIQAYDELTRDCLTETLLRYHHCSYAMMVIIGHLANADLVAAKRYYDATAKDNIGFSLSYEGQFVQGVIEALESNDVDKFTTTVQNWDRVRPLQNPLAGLLVTIKEHIAPTDLTHEHPDSDLT